MSKPDSLPRFQFSLRWMLIAVTVVAVLLGLGAFQAGQMLVGLLFAIVLRGVIPTVAVVAAIYGRGDVRAFAIGAVVACAGVLTTELGSIGTAGLVISTISQLVLTAICGIVAVATRRWLDGRGGSSIS